MPLRYAQEVKFLVHIRIIRRVLEKCEEALQRVPLDSWPVFGGWEFLDPDATAQVPLAVEPEDGFENEGDDRDSDDEDADDESTVPAPANVSVPVSPTSRAVPRVESTLPVGWTKEIQFLSSGRSVPHFYGPREAYSRSLKGAWRQFHASASPPSLGFSMPKVGDRVEVWWTVDKRWFVAVVSEIEVEGSSCVSMVYEVDSESLCHDLSEVRWRHAKPAGQAGGTSAAESASADTRAMSPSDAPRAAVGGAQGGAKRKRRQRESFAANVCGNPVCKMFKQAHGSDLCVYPTPPLKRGRNV